MTRRGGESLDPPVVKEDVSPPPPTAPAFPDLLHETNVDGTSTTSSAVVTLFSNKNFWIAMLVILLILSFLGVNFVMVFGQIFQPIVNVFWILVSQIMGLFGFTTGTVLNQTVNVVSGTAKAGIDIAGGTVQSVGNLLIKGSSSDVDADTQAQIAANILGSAATAPVPEVMQQAPVVPIVPPSTSTLDNVLNRSKMLWSEPTPDTSTSTIQSAATWCLVGEMGGKRACASTSSSNLCLSGQYYKTKGECQAMEGFSMPSNGPLLMATPQYKKEAMQTMQPQVQVAPTGAVVQLPALGPPQYMGPPNFPPPGMMGVEMTIGQPVLGVGPPNYITMGVEKN